MIKWMHGTIDLISKITNTTTSNTCTISWVACTIMYSGIRGTQQASKNVFKDIDHMIVQFTLALVCSLGDVY